MQPRRRRAGSESEHQPLLIITNTDSSWSTGTNISTTQVYNHDASQGFNLENEHSKANLTELEDMTTSKDRTVEFINAAQTLQSRTIQRAVSVRDPRKARIIQSHSEFMLIAKNIGKNLASTYTKLQKITLLARNKSPIDDERRSSEIQELTYIIKGDLNSLNQQIARLKDVSKMSASGKHLQSHSGSVVFALQSKLASMSTDFQHILEIRTENLKQQKIRRDQFSYGPVANSLPPSVVSGHKGSILLADEQVSIDLESSNQLVPRNQQQAMMYDQTDTYLHSRAETMQNIESTIVELGGIFQQLAHMVKEQEEMVERIDTNIQDAELNIEAAHSEILKYFQSVTSNRWLMIKIFAVLICFFIFFVVFLA